MKNTMNDIIKGRIIELEKELEAALESWKLYDSFQGDWDWYVDQITQLESDIELYEKLLTRAAVIKDGCIYIRGVHATKMAAAIEAKGIFSYWEEGPKFNRDRIYKLFFSWVKYAEYPEDAPFRHIYGVDCILK
jgi:hypothetical protein